MSDNILRGKIYKKLHMIEKLYMVMPLEIIIMELMTFEVDLNIKFGIVEGYTPAKIISREVL